MLLLMAGQLQGQERVEVITRDDITPKVSLFERLKGDFLVAPYYTGRTGAGGVLAYSIGEKFLFTGNVSHGESLSVMMFKARYMFALSPSLGIGPAAGYSRIKWKGEEETTAFSAGGVVQYDTRNSVAAPSEGVFAAVRHTNYSDFSSSPYFGTVLQFDTYSQIWNGGVLALDANCEFMYGNVPWNMLSTVGDSQRMRGYQMWKYRNNNALSVQVELRQRVHGMFGMAAWVAGAVLWGKDTRFSMDNFLPEAGVGVRCRLVDNLSLRLDWGFGKEGQNGFVFGINEAF